jgi:hypothetical protein
MDRFQKSAAWLPKLIGAIVITVLLCIFFSLYFIRYIPHQQQLLNGRAFQELEQIGNGLLNKNNAYSTAIGWFLRKPSDNNPLRKTFQFTKPFPPGPAGQSFYAAPMKLIRNDSAGAWQIDYPLCKANDSTLVSDMCIGLDPIVQPIIATYRDIFDNYLVLRDLRTASPERHALIADSLDNFEIAFSSGTLPIDYRVNLDSLIKKGDGFNGITIHDITMEGTPYKLFLYPMQLGRERIVLAGMVASSTYRTGYNTLPFNLVVLVSVLVLLLFMHLPVLKIYQLGKTERIRAFDIRMIIVTYFLAGFLIFFLFSRIFLNHVQSMHNYTRLTQLTTRIEKSFTTEIDQACMQLRQWDTIDPSLVADSTKADSVFQLPPYYYPYADYVFWINDSGKWINSWSNKRTYKPEKLDVHDRAYFNDFVQGNILTLGGFDAADSFTIEPTLSRLDGEYTVNIITKSHPLKGRTAAVIGLSAEMYSVCNPLLPYGYNFSIIDVQGNILYDSKPGRALLSNISRETGSPSDLLAPLRYHSKRYFNSYVLQGRTRALLVTPMKGFPYALLVYYDLAGSDDFQEHLIWLPAFFGALILLLLIISAFIKEQTEKRPLLLRTPIHRFEWLQPSPQKGKYYGHLFLGMLAFICLLVMTWVIMETAAINNEFSLFFISLLFPFYMALNYSLVREKQKNALNPTLLVFLVLVIVAINGFACLGTRSSFSPLLGAQAVLLIGTALSYILFNRNTTGKSRSGRWLRFYVLAIVTGIVVINVLPVCSIFWVVFRQESLVQSNTCRLTLAGSINDRRTTINQRIADYKLSPAYRTRYLDDLHLLKFQYGVYTLNTDNITTSKPGTIDTARPIAASFTQIHRWLFPGDSTALAWPANPNYATDSTWVFEHGKTNWPGPALLYLDQTDAIENRNILLQTDENASSSAFSLMLHETFSAASHFYSIAYFGGIILIFVLLLILTYSLTRRVYLVAFLEKPFPDRLPRAHVVDKINKEEEDYWANPVDHEQEILKNIEKHHPYYSETWDSLDPMEKFTLYDFALDGFTNYKNIATLTRLINRNALIVEDGCLKFMTHGFREWILQARDEKSFAAIVANARENGRWENMRKPLLLLLAIPGIFIFVTQDDVSQKITGFLTALAPLLPLLSSFFPKKEDKE